MKTFTDRLKDLRTDKDMNQTQLAEILNTNQKTYSDYERGRTEPKIQTLIDIAKYFGVSVDYLLGITNVREPYPKA